MAVDASESSGIVRSDQPRDEESKLLRLGAGRFATVFVVEGGAFRALKLVTDNTRAAELEKEYIHLQLIYTRCYHKGSFFHLPRPYSFHASMFAYAEVLNFPTTGILDHAMYSMQRVMPVPPALSSRIRAKFFPAQLRDGLKYKPFLARLYLGKRPQPPPESGRPVFFNHCNFPLTAEMLDELGLPVADIAEGMGRLLSRIHYQAGQDGRDIEFVLGTSHKLYNQRPVLSASGHDVLGCFQVGVFGRGAHLCLRVCPPVCSTFRAMSRATHCPIVAFVNEVCRDYYITATCHNVICKASSSASFL